LAVTYVVLAVIVGLFGPSPIAWGTFPPPAEVRARVSPATLELHRRAVVVDAHADTVQRIVYDGGDFLIGIPGAHLDFQRMTDGAVDAQLFSIFVPPRRTAARDMVAEARRQITALVQLVARSGGKLALARLARDVRANADLGIPSVLLGVEGGHTLGIGSEAERLETLRGFAALGVRYLTLTWTNSNPYGGSSGDAGDTQGLTAEGGRLIDELHRLGVVVDLSHASDPLFWDAIRHARKPVLLSHSSARALANVPRNASDPMLRAVAKNGGAVCINFNPAFLDQAYAQVQRPIWARHRALSYDEGWKRVREDSARLPPVQLSRLAEHIMHAVAIAGPDHVCLGSDFDGIPTLPAGMRDAGDLPALSEELLRRGLSPENLAKVLGANTLRVLELNERQ
jgi:membrane dipeptidase